MKKNNDKVNKHQITTIQKTINVSVLLTRRKQHAVVNTQLTATQLFNMNFLPSELILTNAPDTEAKRT